MSYVYYANCIGPQMTLSVQSNPVTYTYDNHNRLASFTQDTARVSFTYDAADAGRR